VFYVNSVYLKTLDYLAFQSFDYERHLMKIIPVTYLMKIIPETHRVH